MEDDDFLAKAQRRKGKPLGMGFNGDGGYEHMDSGMRRNGRDSLAETQRRKGKPFGMGCHGGSWIPVHVHWCLLTDELNQLDFIT